MKLKPEYFWFAIFALCSIAFQQVQDSIRPNYTGDNALIQYILGVAPNFFPGIGLPAFFVMVIPSFNTRKNPNPCLNENRHLTANLISQTGLLSWEVLQIWTKNGRFDWSDLIWTVLGGLVFHLIWKVVPNKFRHY